MKMSSIEKENVGIKSTIIGRTYAFVREIDKVGNIYECLECKRSINGNSSSNLTKHFKSNHVDIYNQKIATTPEEHILIQREKLVHSCVELTTINSHPFSLLSQSGFRSLIEEKLNAFKLADCPLNLSDHHVYEIKEKVCDTAQKIREQIKVETRGKMISVMVDSATRNGRSIYGVSIQYKFNGVLRVFAVGMRELFSAHTGEHLAEQLLLILAEYDINLEQVLSITTDNGSNMLAMVKEVDMKLRQELEVETSQKEVIADSSHQNPIFPLEDDDQTDVLINQVLEEVTIDDEDVIDSLLDNNDMHEMLLNSLVSNLRSKSANSELFVNSIKCAAHTIQLAVNDAINSLPNKDQNVIGLCRLAAKFMRKQTTKNMMLQAKLTSILPSLDCKTRWSSTYLMVRSSHSEQRFLYLLNINLMNINFVYIFQIRDILKIRPVIEHFAPTQKFMRLLLKKWDVVKELKQILHVPYMCTVLLQKPDFTLSDFYGCVQIMNMKLEQILQAANKRHTKLAEKLRRCLNSRKDKLLKNPLMLCAMFLDPRYKCDVDSDPEKVVLVKLTLEKLWSRIKTVKQCEPSNDRTPNVESSIASEDNFTDLFEQLDKQYDAMGVCSGQTDTNYMPVNQPDFSADKNDIFAAIGRYETFLAGSRMKSSESIHTFWEANKTKFSLELYEIANVIFAIPPTQATVERSFSALKYLFSDYRYNLDKNLLESCLLIHLNPEMYYLVKRNYLNAVYELTKT